MSRTYSLICKDCKKALWVAQGEPDDEKSRVFYSGYGKVMAALKDFLFDHQNHCLSFVDDEMLDAGIEEIDIENR